MLLPLTTKRRKIIFVPLRAMVNCNRCMTMWNSGCGLWAPGMGNMQWPCRVSAT